MKVPLGVLCCVTGVSGSGKSTLVNEVLYKAVANRLHRTKQRAGAHKRITGLEQLDKIISVDQSPIGRTPRSNPATYIGLFDQIRELFSKTQEARARGYKPGRFSFNVKGGRCEVCRGDGQIKIEMHFLPDVYVPCEQCHGKRYNRETLEVRFKGKTIADVLEMPIEEALGFFQHIPKIHRRVQTLNDVGLGYMRLGQPATTLSGGEAQRVKLAAELRRVATGRTIYILDEPTTGLHFADIQRLLEVLERLVAAGNSIVVIEHNLDVIRVADRLIDLGPEGGDEGGRLIATGTPEQVAGGGGVEHRAVPRAAAARRAAARRHDPRAATQAGSGRRRLTGARGRRGAPERPDRARQRYVACGRAQAVGAEVALVRAQQPALEPGADPLGVDAPRGVRRAGRSTATCSRRCATAGSRWGRGRCSSPGCGSRRPVRPGSASGPARFLNLGVMVAASELVEIGDHCMFANGCFVSDAATASTIPSCRCPGRASRRRGRPGSATTCGAGPHVVVTSGVTIGERCVIGANSVVTADIPPFSIAAGAPARVIRPITYR